MKILIAAAALGSIAVPAMAEKVSFEVEHRDLNLSTAEGQKALDRRIDSAARKACGVDVSTTGTRIRSSDARACYREMRAKARKQFAALTASEKKGG